MHFVDTLNYVYFIYICTFLLPQYVLFIVLHFSITFVSLTAPGEDIFRDIPQVEETTNSIEIDLLNYFNKQNTAENHSNTDNTNNNNTELENAATAEKESQQKIKYAFTKLFTVFNKFENRLFAFFNNHKTSAYELNYIINSEKTIRNSIHFNTNTDDFTDEENAQNRLNNVKNGFALWKKYITCIHKIESVVPQSVRIMLSINNVSVIYMCFVQFGCV